ncbi:hypothetical protein BT69DRAFT_310725 [Atractiella rhizophila]|nr:hypothetical protein BT69DRAFT_310725 [Atractiella rhizophila]
MGGIMKSLCVCLDKDIFDLLDSIDGSLDTLYILYLYLVMSSLPFTATLLTRALLKIQIIVFLSSCRFTHVATLS